MLLVLQRSALSCTASHRATVWFDVQSSPTGDVVLGSSPEGSFEHEMLRFMQVASLLTVLPFTA